MVFTAGAALRISGQVLPKDAREMTVLCVARADSPSSIGLFSIRNAARPLVQLDVDQHAQTRFIVRDGQSRTLAATTPCLLNAKTIFGGILSKRDEATGEVTRPVRHEPRVGATRQSFASPLIDEGAWIGASECSRNETVLLGRPYFGDPRLRSSFG